MSAVLRVTMVRSCCKLVAARRLSMTGNGAPRRSDSPTKEPQRSAIRTSIGRTRPRNRSARSRRTQLMSLVFRSRSRARAMPFSSSPKVSTLKNNESSSASYSQASTDAFGSALTSSDMTQVSRRKLKALSLFRCRGCGRGQAQRRRGVTCGRNRPGSPSDDVRASDIHQHPTLQRPRHRAR